MQVDQLVKRLICKMSKHPGEKIAAIDKGSVVIFETSKNGKFRDRAYRYLLIGVYDDGIKVSDLLDDFELYFKK